MEYHTPPIDKAAENEQVSVSATVLDHAPLLEPERENRRRARVGHVVCDKSPTWGEKDKESDTSVHPNRLER
jgi:hypothetical protein